MAKTQGPLLSKHAHGTLGGVLTFSLRKKVNQVRFQRKQKDRVTSSRSTQRSYFVKAVSWWHELNSAEQAEWHTEAMKG